MTKPYSFTGVYTLVIIFILCNLAGFAGNYVIRQDGQTKVTVLENSVNSLRLNSELSSIGFRDVKTDVGVFTELRVEGFTGSSLPGFPNVPVLRKIIEIPAGALVSVKLTGGIYQDYTAAELGIEHRLMPVQPPVPKSGDRPDFKYNKSAYESNALSPAETVASKVLGTMRGTRLGRIDICHILYNPVLNTYRIYSEMDILVTFIKADEQATKQIKRTYASPYFPGPGGIVINPLPLGPSEDSITSYPVTYVIVSHPSFETALQPFINWKTRKGFKVIEAYTDNPNVGTTTTSIKNYLTNLYQNPAPGYTPPSFILFVGDVAQVPAFNGNAGNHVTDLYYAEYTGDFLPEVYYGRFSATNETQLAPQIDKTLEYEQYLMPDPSFLNEVVMIAGVDPNWAPIHANGQINYGTDNYFNTAHGITSHTYLYPQSGSSAAQIRQDVSNGVGYANYTAHGGSNGWSDPSFSNNDIPNLQNAHKYPLMVGNACLTNKFDDPVCFGEALLRASNKGALGYIGGSNSTYWDEDFYWGVGVKSIVANPVWIPGNPGAYDLTFHDHGEPFSEWYTTQGQMIVAGNLAVTQGSPGSMDYYWEIYHLMGDPSLMVYFSVPPALTATFNAVMPPASPSFTVNTIPYAYAAISRNGVLYGAALADNNGEAIIPLIPINTPGYVSLVITAQNQQPLIDSVMVDNPSGPFVLMNSYQIVDNLGNNNNKVDFGESITLNMALKNWGLADAQNVMAKLTSTDPYISVTDSAQVYGNIQAGQLSSLNNVFAFNVSNNVPDQHSAPFLLNISDGSGNTWTTNLNIIVNAPAFTVHNLSIVDNNGNNNGRLDPGETVQLIVTSTNSGHSDAPLTVGNIMTSSGLFTLTTSGSNLNTVNAGAACQATFTGTVSSSAITGDIIDFSFTISSGAYQAQKTFSPSVGLIVEDWESGTVTHFLWVTAGANPWYVTNVGAYEGQYCLHSGAIPNNQSCDLYLAGDVLAQDSISFYYKVSSEEDYDKLIFKVNNVDKGDWSGEKGWDRAAYEVLPGPVTFKWSYDKDWSTISGGDCAWLDYIVFPPMTGITSAVTDPLTNNPTLSLFPNPAAEKTTIVYCIGKQEKIDMRLFNALGQEVAVIVNQTTLGAGSHTSYFDISQLEKGVYFLRFIFGNQEKTSKLVVN